MNRYSYSDMYLGQTEQFSVYITENMVENFFNLTNDRNPLHRNAAFAKSMGYETCVVYGMLTASFMSTLAGVYLPGENSLIHECQMSFVKPVFPGDMLTVKGEVSELNDTVKQIVIKVQMCNARNEKVLRGKMKVGFVNGKE